MSSAASSNRLIHEKSPYLLQHAHNPVDWYPWGPEAFEKAKKEQKPILVSIGYSTCHWCHVMERESYEDADIAKLMNAHFVNIKVDREERPDVDKIYMTAVSAITGQGGWPLNAFLTPDLKPFYGGTYFPPSARWGQPAWRDVLNQITDSWAKPEERQKIIDAGDHVHKSLQQYAAASHDPLDPDVAWLAKGYTDLKGNYDSQRGGFGSAPKFPMPVYHNFLLRYYARTGEGNALEMSVKTLKAMAQGGIYDHLGGGFARYSTDENWHVPHFEKMLYDNAQLAVNYTEAFQINHDPQLAQIARETLKYVQRDMTHPEGGFYSAEDADSLSSADEKEKKEGAFYVWDAAEVRALLTPQAADLFCFRYGVRPEGNARHDPHGEFIKKNILYVAHPVPEAAREFKLTVEQAEESLKASRKILFDARAKRPRPHLDDKVLSSWNGLMISAFAKGYQVFAEPGLLSSAQRSAAFLKKNLYDPDSKVLYRSWREGQRQVPGIADDYAFLAQGLIDLYESNFDPQWLDWAEELTRVLLDQFQDTLAGGFFMSGTTDQAHLLVRVKEDMDNVEPSASAVAALNLLRLSQYRDDATLETAAKQTIRAFGGQMRSHPRALPQMLVAVDFFLTEPRQVVIAGEPTAADTEALLKVLYARFIPVRTVMLADGLRGMRPLEGKAAAYLCIRHNCKSPTNDPAVFATLLSQITSGVPAEN